MQGILLRGPLRVFFSDEDQTQLYDVFGTSLSTINQDFGIGIFLYFIALLSLAGTTFVAGLLSFPQLFFFSSSYSNLKRFDNIKDSVRNFLLVGSAVCTDSHFVTVSNCYEVPPEFPTNRFRLDTCEMKRNTCGEVSLIAGLFSWITVIFVAISVVFIFFVYQAKIINHFDEEELTASDYSIMVKNPPKDARNPDEWMEFFSQFTDKKVRFVTVVLNNCKILRELTRRRLMLQKLESMLPPNTNMSEIRSIKTAVDSYKGKKIPSWKKIICPSSYHDVNKLYKKIFEGKDSVTEKIVKLSKDKNQTAVNKVFITFETEEDQRNVLSCLSSSPFEAFTGFSNTAPQFRGTILRVERPAEPSDVRWENIGENVFVKLTQRVIATFSIFLLSILCAFAVERSSQSGSYLWSAFLIWIFNILIPFISAQINKIQFHSTEASYQTNLFYKMTFFRWINTAVVILLVTRFPNYASTYSTGHESLLTGVSRIFIADIVLTPLLLFVDPIGFIRRHILGPRATTQKKYECPL